jgi:hypothetical protein
VDFKDLKTVAEAVAMAASSGAHLAGLLKGAGYPGVAASGRKLVPVTVILY